MWNATVIGNDRTRDSPRPHAPANLSLVGAAYSSVKPTFSVTW